MKNQTIFLNLVLFLLLFSVINDQSSKKKYTSISKDELLLDKRVLKKNIISSNTTQNFNIDNNFDYEINRSNDYLPIYKNDRKMSKILGTANSDAFISRWDTRELSSGSSNTSQIKLPLEFSGTYNFTVNWGDNTYDLITDYNQAEVTHTYESAGNYTLIINGTLNGWQFNDGGDKFKLLEISQWGDINLGNSGSYFYGCHNLALTAIDAPDLIGTTTLHGVFQSCMNLGNNGNMNLWDVSSVIDMNEMFYCASSFNQPINEWDVSKVTDMTEMFVDAISFNQPIGEWDVSKVQHMGGMFKGASSFNQNIGNWDVSSVIGMTCMFCGASSFNQSIGNWEVYSVIYMHGMFNDASSFNQHIGEWDVSNVIYMGEMFNGANSFNQSINEWDVSSVTDMSEMFVDAISFNQPIGEWDVSNVDFMNEMFCGAISFNQPIGEWDVSNVIDMADVFCNTTSFNQPIGEWDVSNVIYMHGMFYGARSFNQPISYWKVSKVINMADMFRDSTSFNQNIGNWDVFNVINMHSMFYGASTFNHDINSWNVSSVTDMSSMFYNATSFNLPVGDWDVSKVTNMANMFFNVTLSTQNYDLLLLGWAQLSLQSEITLHAGYSKYSVASVNAREHIITTFSWTIIDGGLSSTDQDDKNTPGFIIYSLITGFFIIFGISSSKKRNKSEC